VRGETIQEHHLMMLSDLAQKMQNETSNLGSGRYVTGCTDKTLMTIKVFTEDIFEN
jgi:hypothetical protein